MRGSIVRSSGRPGVTEMKTADFVPIMSLPGELNAIAGRSKGAIR